MTLKGLIPSLTRDISGLPHALQPFRQSREDVDGVSVVPGRPRPAGATPVASYSNWTLYELLATVEHTSWSRFVNAKSWGALRPLVSVPVDS